MARPGSVAVGGYFATPSRLLSPIAALFKFQQVETPSYSYSQNRLVVMDPCAGEGEAIVELGLRIAGAEGREDKGRGAVEFYTCELEKSRYDALSERLHKIGWYQNTTLHGDAFQIEARTESGGVGFLFLNPPYDFDAKYSRLEERFLSRFASFVRVGGALAFVVPYYALKASAATIAREFENVHVFRFPGEEFDAFKQVVLVANKREPLFAPDPELEARILAWSASADSIPELPTNGPSVVTISAWTGYKALNEWRIRDFDIIGLLDKVRPWKQTQRSGALTYVPHTIPETPIKDVMLRHYPVATPPRPAHIAAGIASGLFNGARIESRDRRLPPLLVKGVFDREYRTVEEKTNKDGDVTSVVQVQQPKLVTTVLDLKEQTYHILKNEETGSFKVSEMGVSDLLKHYGDSLMKVMEAQCPILYDPRKDEHTVTLPSSPRKLFTAQAHAVRAIVRLLGGMPTPVRGSGRDRMKALRRSVRERRSKAAILLGEIGSGKTTVALMAGKTIGSRRMLAMCPPHLLDSWKNEVAAVRPDARVVVLESISDVQALAADTSGQPVIAILSRETGKLGHSHEGVTGACPACGGAVPAIDLVKKRYRCEEQRLIPLDNGAKLSLAVARKLSLTVPRNPRVTQLLRHRVESARLDALKEKEPAKFTGLSSALLDGAVEFLFAVHRALPEKRESAARGLVAVCLLDRSEARIEALARRFMDAPSRSYEDESMARSVMHLLAPNSKVQTRLVEEFKAGESKTSYWNDPWKNFASEVKISLGEGESYQSVTVAGAKLTWLNGQLHLDGDQVSPLRAAERLLEALSSSSRWALSEACGEPLYQATPEPRRYPVARYIAKWFPRLFDLLVLDEGHEYATDGSAQERSAHRLTSLGLPTILMTGTIMNGYAESLFTNMWALSADFRDEFNRDERGRFVERYGYRKRLLQDKEIETGKVVAFGSHTDRVERTERTIGNAPGVLPVFLLRHLLPFAVTLHKTDLAIDLPTCRQERCLVEGGPELIRRFRRLQEALIQRIKRDQFDEVLAGKLFGQLAELPSYLDRATADVGNSEDGTYTIRYPESVGGNVVASEAPFSASSILPKEAWMLDTIEREIKEGRNVIVMAWHVGLLPRLARLISERIGEPVPVLHADKVTTAKRQAWIDKEIVKKRRHVLVTNPVAIQTGLNNLIHFSTEIWMENPACNPITFRQAVGRIDRIGQRKETRVLVPVYDGTLQIQLYDLLMHKVAVSISTDGLDPESAMRAAGIGEDDYLTGLSIGKQLWAMLSGDMAVSAPARAPAAGVRRLKAAR